MPDVSSSYEVVTFGEGLLRFSPSRYERLEQAAMVDVHVAGDELEVAAGISRLGLHSAWASLLPDNPLGRKIVNKAREHGVDTSGVCWCSSGRVGLVYIEPGSAPRATRVFEDRDGSAFQSIRTGQIDWSILGRCRLFHAGSRTPFPGSASMAVMEEGLAAARHSECLVSLGLDVLPSMTPYERRWLVTLFEGVDIVMATEQGAREHVEGGDADLATLASRLQSVFHAETAAVAAGRLHTPRMGTWTGASVADTLYHDRTYELEVIDPAGAFNAFIAGFLTGFLTDGPDTGLRYGNASAALAHSIPGHLSWIGLEEVHAQLRGEGAALQR